MMITIVKTVFLAMHQPVRAITYLAANVACAMAQSTNSGGGFGQVIIQNTAVVAFVIAASLALFSDELLPIPRRGRKKGAKTRKRTRLNIQEHFNEMGALVFRRNYRMDEQSFWTLLDIIGNQMPSAVVHRQNKRGVIPNGPITKATRLSIALRYFAGGDPLDIASIHKVGQSEILKCVWIVTDAVNKSSQLDIKFPESHSEQLLVADGFKNKSKIDLDNCVGLSLRGDSGSEAGGPI
jgi:hypothetical protein